MEGNVLEVLVGKHVKGQFYIYTCSSEQDQVATYCHLVAPSVSAAWFGTWTLHI